MAAGSGLIGSSVNLRDLRSVDEAAHSWRRVPGLTREALGVAWHASRRQVILSLLLQAGVGAATTLQLLAAQRVLSKLLVIAEPGVTGADVIPAFAALIVAMIALGALGALAEERQRLLAELVAQHAFREIIAVSSQVELSAFETPTFHDQLDRARTSAITRSVQMVGSISSLTLNLLTSAGIGVALLILQPLLLPLIVLSALPLLIATVRNSHQSYAFEWGMTPENRERAYLIELLTRPEAAKELRVFGATEFLRDRYEDLSAERLFRFRQFLRRRRGTALFGAVASSVGLGFALGALAMLIVWGKIDVPTAMAAGAAMQQLSSRLFGIMSSLGQVIESGMFVDDYTSFLTLLEEGGDKYEFMAPGTRGTAEDRAATSGPDEAPRPEDAGPAEERFRGLAVERVSFTYPETDRRVLDEVSLRIDPGEVVALVGENGSGKTTLVKLICQLYRPDSGRIRWAGSDGGDADPERMREDTTVVFQDFIHYYLSARDNIALGRATSEPTLEVVERAARRAGAHEFLGNLPDGYETRLGRHFDDGKDLSIGQWQRLSLARAFFRGGGFLVLDEPTASLDPRAEHELFREMRALWQGRSVLLISHRFSSVREADRIYVMQRGRMTEDGSHDELIEAGGHYAELFTIQADAYLGRRGSRGKSGSTRKNAHPAGVSSS